MKKLICSLGLMAFVFTLAPVVFAGDLPKKAGVYCKLPHGDDYKVVQIPDKEKVIAICLAAGGVVWKVDEM